MNKNKKVLYALLSCIIAIAAGFSGCQECDDCGVLYRDPLVNIKFYNIDSLVKVDSALIVVEDSLEIVNDEIDNGNTDLIETRDQLEEIKSDLEKTQKDINDGKLRIEEVNGIGALEPLYFRDSTTNDSLTIFPFPLSMHDILSTFIIEIEDRIDTLNISYLLTEDAMSNNIIMQAIDLELGLHTYDSARISCNKESCTSNETTISIYF